MEENKLVELDTSKWIYSAGDEGFDKFGQKVNDEEFKFVQEDKKIHDVKFTTKPTTFFKDALIRFRKNQSSVVGGIILGVLFALAIIIPIGNVVPYDITSTHNYETHLPMKLFSPNGGFWDGTKLFEDSPYPYVLDENNEIVYDEDGYPEFNDYAFEEYTDPYSAIYSATDPVAKYADQQNTYGEGGYATITKSAAVGRFGIMYCYPYKFDLNSNNYSVTYQLGTKEVEGYVDPEYALFAKIENDDTKYVLTDYTSNYGTEVEKERDIATVTPHKKVTYNLNDLISQNGYTSTFEGKNYSVGFIFKSDANKETAIHVKSFEITGTKKDQSALSKKDQSDLKARSFGGTNSAVKDANTLVNLEKKLSDGAYNTSYWSRESDGRFDVYDVYSVTCDTRVDMYAVTYGLKSGINISEDTFKYWLGYRTNTETKVSEKTAEPMIKYTFGNPNSFEITEYGEECGEVYVDSVDSDINDNNIHTMKCTVVMYKYLGYDSMPVHIFGTEAKGKDMLKYVFSGLRTSLILGFIVAIINIIIGVIWGSISGYFGGAVDIIMERITDILSGIPWIVLMTILILNLGSDFFVFALSLCLTGWIGTASVTRSQFYRYRDREYVLASKTLGAKSPRLIFRHILPNAIGTIVTSSILMIPSVIFSEATISYLGLGLKNLDSLGVILSDTQNTMQTYPSELIFPAIIISLLMICFNLFGNGLRDAFNPQLKGSE